MCEVMNVMNVMTLQYLAFHIIADLIKHETELALRQRSALIGKAKAERVASDQDRALHRHIPA